MSKNESLDPEAGWKKLRTYWVGKWWYDPNMPRLPPWTKDDVDQFVKECPTEGRQLKKLRFRFKLRVKIKIFHWGEDFCVSLIFSCFYLFHIFHLRFFFLVFLFFV